MAERSLSKMSDAEFVRALRDYRARGSRASRGEREAFGVGKTLGEVFAAEQQRLVARCFALSLVNMDAMARTPTRTNEWWAPTRVVACVDARRIEEFVALLGAVPQYDETYQIPPTRTHGLADLSLIRWRVRAQCIERALVWWEREDAEGSQSAPMFGVTDALLKARRLAEWKTMPASALVVAADNLEWRSVLDDAPRADPEPRAALRLTPVAKTARKAVTTDADQETQIQTPWGRVVVSGVPAPGMLAHIERIATAAVEVPLLVESLTEAP